MLHEQFRLTAKVGKVPLRASRLFFSHIDVDFLNVGARLRCPEGMRSGRRYFLPCFIQHRIKIHFDSWSASLSFFPHRT